MIINSVYQFQSPRVSPLFLDSECLLYYGTRTVYFVQAPIVLKETKCLPCYVMESVCLVMAHVFTITAGPSLERVQWVQLHPSILDNGCMHPSIFRPDTSFTVFSSFFIQFLLQKVKFAPVN